MFQVMPEELIERILRIALEPDSPKEMLEKLRLGEPEASRSSILLVSRKFYRIALPIFYSYVHLSTRQQAADFLQTIWKQFSFVHFVRDVTFAGVWAEAGLIMQMCGPNLTGIEYTLDRQTAPLLGMAADPSVQHQEQWPWVAYAHHGGYADDVDLFCHSLQSLRKVKHLTVRKAHNLYITSSRAQILIQETANAIMNWSTLTNVEMLFTLPDDEGRLCHALATQPNLRALTTCLPSIWNSALLTISENPSLEKITLLPSSSPRGSLDFSRVPSLTPATSPLVPNGLFLTEAKNHPRLVCLLRQGTMIMV